MKTSRPLIKFEGNESNEHLVNFLIMCSLQFVLLK